MLIKKPSDISSSEITPRGVYLNRRNFLAGAATLAGATLLGGRLHDVISPNVAAMASTKLNYSKGPFGTTEKQTPLQDITHYNNYYEFSTDKYEPADLAKNFQTRPWTVRVEGLVNKPQTFDIDALLKMPLEEPKLTLLTRAALPAALVPMRLPSTRSPPLWSWRAPRWPR